ncbi:glycoside hydrolase family 130 protein [Kiritimatiella glycovorans]|uniref:Putative glycoside hydrolase n=1 Tax=Kiritimatiella glycovorans TaxID=1307763 RepID=A0A0G3EB31_9BACT|nr:glycoside hydrolase family 130 protein [Kiritimatiella glycovorans]AKJ63706.1 putative glycoside hydrolase [Kiritimatiella glycovorans]
MTRLLNKYEGNPVVSPADVPGGGAMQVFNPGAIKLNGEYLLLMDVADLSACYHFRLARSRDGYAFTVDDQPVDWPPSDPDFEEQNRYDPRITKIGDSWYIMFAARNDRLGVRTGLVSTRDFVHFERHPNCSELNNRNGVLFPEKIGGLYARLDRPMGNPHVDPANIWISYSPDLVFWGRTKPVLQVRPGEFWDAQKVGAGAVPIRTPQGWLEIYHGVEKTCNGFIYRLGVCLLDLEDPSKVIARGRNCVLWPEHGYEDVGRSGTTVFTCNALLEEDGETVKIYYGAADRCIGLAEGKLSDLLAACYT